MPVSFFVFLPGFFLVVCRAWSVDMDLKKIAAVSTCIAVSLGWFFMCYSSISCLSFCMVHALYKMVIFSGFMSSYSSAGSQDLRVVAISPWFVPVCILGVPALYSVGISGSIYGSCKTVAKPLSHVLNASRALDHPSLLPLLPGTCLVA